jgi:hypothetical protein
MDLVTLSTFISTVETDLETFPNSRSTLRVYPEKVSPSSRGVFFTLVTRTSSPRTLPSALRNVTANSRPVQPDLPTFFGEPPTLARTLGAEREERTRLFANLVPFPPKAARLSRRHGHGGLKKTTAKGARPLSRASAFECGAVSTSSRP